jgi:UDP-glucose 4-epimerase
MEDGLPVPPPLPPAKQESRGEGAGGEGLLEQAFKNRSVLVTGGAGFIGSHLVERLTAVGANVTVLDNLRAGAWDNLRTVADSVRTVEADVRDAHAVEQIFREVMPQFVFHLAANASVPGSVKEPEYDFEANCVGTFHVLNALRLIGGCERVVIASSGAVYGEPAAFPIRETDPLQPISPYGASKLNTEVTTRMFQRVYGVPGVLARLFNAYGPRMARFVVLDFLRKLQHDPARLEILGTGQQVRDSTYVADTVEGLLTLATVGAAGEAYNLSSGAYTSVTGLAECLLAQLGLTGRTELAYTGTSWIGDAQRWEVSLAKIGALGYRSRWTLDAGLAETIRWFEETEGVIKEDG